MARELKPPPAAAPGSDDARSLRDRLAAAVLGGVMTRQFPGSPEEVAEKVKRYADAVVAALTAKTERSNA